MKKNIKFRFIIKCLLIFFSITAFFPACNSSIKAAQEFIPNRLPVIDNITRTLPAGITADTLANGITVKLEVTAHDPEGKALSYNFSSEQGNFGNIAKTATGCTAEFYTRNVNGGAAVTMTVSVTDQKGAIDSRGNYNLGTGRSGPKVNIDETPSNLTKEYIKSAADTKFVFSSNSEGYFQIILDNSATPETIAMRPDDPIFMYVPSADPENPKMVSAIVAGANSTTAGKVKLTNQTGVNKVWLLFWDGLKQYDKKCFIITHDDIPPTYTDISPDGIDKGIRTNVDLIFSEPVTISGSSVDIKDSTSTSVLNRFKTPVIADSHIVYESLSDLDSYETYTTTINAGAVITDRAGNQTTLALKTKNFTTQAKAELAEPTFLKTDEIASVTDGEVFNYNSSETIKTKYVGSNPDNTVSGVSVNYTTVTEGGTPADPLTTNYSLPSVQTISFNKNTTIKATAYKKGYKSKSKIITVKMKTKTPIGLSLSNGSSYPNLPSPTYIYPSIAGGSITFTPVGSSGNYYMTSSVATATDPPQCEDPTVINGASSIIISGNGKRVYLKARAQMSNMELSDIYTSDLFVLRELNLPKSELFIPETGYETYVISGRGRIGPMWTSIASSHTGQYLAATENSSAGTDKGYIWISDDFGTTWKSTGSSNNWKKIVSSADGSKLAATEATNGYIWISTDYGVNWSIKNPPAGSGPWLIAMNDNGDITAALDGGITSYLYSAGTWKPYSTSSYQIKYIACDNTPTYSYAFLILSSVPYSAIFNGTSWGAYNNLTGGMTNFLGFSKSNNPTSTIFAAIGNDNSSINSIWISSSINQIGLSNSKINALGTYDWKGIVASDNVGYIAVIENNSYPSSSPTKGKIWRNKFLNVFSNSSAQWTSSVYQFGTQTTQRWSAIASSYNGDILSATTSGSDIWIGTGNVTDQGTSSENWTWNWSYQGLRTWSGIACSKKVSGDPDSGNGKFIIASDSGAGGHGGYIYTSSTYGSTWTEHKEAGQKNWLSVAISSDGKYMAAITESQFWYKYENNPWTQATPAHNAAIHFTKVSVSGTSDIEKSRIAIITDSAYRFILKRNGSTCRGNGSNMNSSSYGNFTDLKISDDGTSFVMAAPDKIVKVTLDPTDSSDPVYSSINLSGFLQNANYWTRLSATPDLSTIYLTRYSNSITGYYIDKITNFFTTSYTLNSTAISGAHINSFYSSDDGYRLVLSNQLSNIYSSIDAGETWSHQTDAGVNGWNCVTSTADGLIIYAGNTKTNNIVSLK